MPSEHQSFIPVVEQWVDQYGDTLYRYALLRVRNPDVAQDLVQETFLAALKSPQTFRNESAPQTWLIGILKHKIFDHFRKETKTAKFQEALPMEDDPTETHFNESKRWKSPLKSWDLTPEEKSEDSALAETVSKCLDHLTESQREIFLLRELDEIESGELCKLFQITPTNLWVILHRIRNQLRNCLEKNWFK